MHPDDDARNDQSPAEGILCALMLIIPFYALAAALTYAWA